MTRSLAWLCAAALCLAALGEAALDCEGAPDISCNAFAALDITSTAGTCEGSAGASCEAVGSSQNAFKEAFEDWYGEGSDACSTEAIEAAATAVAVAVAEVWTSAAAKVTCDGYGFACGWAIADGNAFALAFAEAIASAAAEAVSGDAADSFCYADIRAVSTVLAEAAAAAQESACVEDKGTAEGFKEAYVQAAKAAVADAFASASASACQVEGEAVADSLCLGEAKSTTDEAIAYLSGDECAGTRVAVACKGPGNDMCCDATFDKSYCNCEDCVGPWVKISKGGDAKKVFENKKKDLCFCVDTPDDSAPLIVEDTPEETEDSSPSDDETATPEETDEEPETEDDSTEPAPTKSVEETPIDAKEVPEPEEGSSDPGVEADTPTSQTEDGTEDTSTPPEESAESVVDEEEEQETDDDSKESVPKCPGAVDTTCSAFATLDILVTGGTCSGKASASCDAITDSQNQFKEAYDEWWGEDGICQEGKASAASEAIAQAIAKVWADAAVQVTCEGVGFACGWTASGGQAWAIGFAEALAQAAAEAGGGGANGFCYADIRAVSVVIAEAAAEAQASACTQGGTAEDFQNSYAAAIEIGIATAFAEATAFACDAGDELTAASRCDGKATSETFGDAYATDDACAGIRQITPCSGPGKDMCCDPSFTRALCLCTRQRCENGPWVRKSDFNYETNTKRSFEDRAKNVCFCLD